MAATGPIKSWQRRAASSSTTRRSTTWLMSACWHGGEGAATTRRLLNLAFIQFEAIEQRGGAVEILRTIGIKEGVDTRHLGKGHGREPIARRPDVHFANTLIDQGPSQRV